MRLWFPRFSVSVVSAFMALGCIHAQAIEKARETQAFAELTQTQTREATSLQEAMENQALSVAEKSQLAQAYLQRGQQRAAQFNDMIGAPSSRSASAQPLRALDSNAPLRAEVTSAMNRRDALAAEISARAAEGNLTSQEIQTTSAELADAQARINEALEKPKKQFRPMTQEEVEGLVQTLAEIRADQEMYLQHRGALMAQIKTLPAERKAAALQKWAEANEPTMREIAAEADVAIDTFKTNLDQ